MAGEEQLQNQLNTDALITDPRIPGPGVDMTESMEAIIGDIEARNKVLLEENLAVFKQELRTEMSSILTATLAAQLAKQRGTGGSGHNAAQPAEPASTTTMGQSTANAVEPGVGAYAIMDTQPGDGHNTTRVVEPSGITVPHEGSTRQKRSRADDDTVSVRSTYSAIEVDPEHHKKRRRRSNSRSRSRSRSRRSSHSGHKSKSSHHSRTRTPESGRTSQRTRDNHSPAVSRSHQSRPPHSNKENVEPMTSKKQDTATLEESQNYWTQQCADYEEETKVGPEISSLVAGTAKIYWQKELKDERLKEVHLDSKIPGNCTFLEVKEVNKQIFNKGAPYTRSLDIKLQAIQKEHSLATGNMIRSMALL